MRNRSKICSVPGCPEIVTNSNGKCPHHRRKAQKASDKRTGRVRGSRWMAIRKQVVRDQPFCRDGRACGHRAMSAEVDHIKPLCFGGHPTERANLQGICHACHVEKTREEQKLFQQMQGD